MWLDIPMIIIGAFAYRSAIYIYSAVRQGDAARLALRFSVSPAREFLEFYVIAGLPIAFLNGYLIRLSWIDCVVVGVGTWVGMLVAIALSRQFNPVTQFYSFAALNLISLGVNVVRIFIRVS